MKYLCPVCGFLLDYPPEDFNICPSCGVEFDADTVEHSIADLHKAWVGRGMRWTSTVIPRPADYNPAEQLRRLPIANSIAGSSEHEEIVLSQALPPRIKPRNAITSGNLEIRVA